MKVVHFLKNGLIVLQERTLSFRGADDEEEAGEQNQICAAVPGTAGPKTGSNKPHRVAHY
jgi:hypothetical protein